MPQMAAPCFFPVLRTFLFVPHQLALWQELRWSSGLPRQFKITPEEGVPLGKRRL